LEQVKIVLFAFNGAFGARTGITVALPEGSIAGEEGVEAVVFMRVGIDDPAIRRARAAVIKEGTAGQVISFLGGGQGTTPFEAEAVRTEAPVGHRSVGRTDGDRAFEP
jgi:hypothetical protein